VERLRLVVGSRHWLPLAALALVALALGTAVFSGASFTSKSANSASLAAGSVQLSSTAPGQAIVAASGMKPGGSSEGTISIGNQGDVAGTLTLKAAGLTGSALAAVITLRIDDVTGSTSKKYEGKLSAFSSLSLGSFSAGTTRKYRFTLSWPEASNEASLQGISTSLGLQWEADNGFTDTTQNSLSLSAAADFAAPTASGSTIAKTQGGAAGYIKKGGTYFVYANVADSGNPASGVASVKADVHSITSGQTEVTLVAGSYVADGVAYNYRNAEPLTANSSLGSGSKSYTLDLTDKAGNDRETSFSVTVYAPFVGSDFETDNVAGGTEGKPEKGDTVSFEFNNLPEAKTIVENWNGSGTKSVTVTIAGVSTNDTLTVSGANIGSVELKADFTKTTPVTFAGSSLSLSGSTVTIVLGTVSGEAETGAKSKPSWTPSASILDLAANACSTSGVNGANKKQF